MVVKSGMFNSNNGDRKYDANWLAFLFGTLIKNGVFANPTSNFQVIAGDNMTTIVRQGTGWINGYLVVNDDDFVISHDISDGVLKRIDRIVLQLDLARRSIEIVVKKGVLASNPKSTNLVRDSSVYELAIADVLINNGATQITQSNITDLRSNSAVCGFVKGTIDEIDTTNLFAQYSDAFKRWFDELQAQLSGNVATNLQNQITNHKTSLISHEMIDDVTGIRYEYGFGVSNGEFYLAREVKA